MKNRSVIGNIIFIQIVLFRKGMTEASLNCSGKAPVLKERLTMFVIVGRSAGRHCFRIEVGIGLVSQKELDDCKMSLLISSLVV